MFLEDWIYFLEENDAIYSEDQISIRFNFWKVLQQVSHVNQYFNPISYLK